MNSSIQKVGRITVAIGLVGFGIALLVDNLRSGQEGLTLLLKLWPLLLIGFGAEYFIRSFLVQRAGTETKLKFDWGGAFLLFFIAMLAVGITMVRSFIVSGPEAIISGLSFGPAISKSDQWNIPADGVKELVTDIDIGSVTVTQNSRTDTIRVEATYSANGYTTNREDVRSRLDQIKMKIDQGATVRLTPEIPVPIANPSIHYTVCAPPGIAIKASTGAGWIDVTTYKGDLNLNSRVGRISVIDGSGNLTADSGSGYVSVKGFDGPVSARTSVGALDISDVDGPVQLDTGTGTIQVREFRGGKLVAESRMGSVHATTRSVLEGDVILRTQSGTVGLTVPKESSMRVSAQTRTGSVNMPGTISVSRNGPASSATGSTGDGTYTVTLEANTGTVSLQTE